MDETTTEESGWTRGNLLKLLGGMKSSIPEHDRVNVYTKGLRTIDWNEVAFPPFSPEECEKKWREILQKMRKIRSLTELIVEAEDTISNPVHNIKIHPELPKRPIPPNAIFCEENWAKYHKKHREMSKPDLFRHINKMYQRLADEEKGKYVEKFELAKEEYSKKMQEFSEKYKTGTAKRKRKKVSADTPDGKKSEDLPPKPPINGRNLFYKEKSVSTSSRSGNDDAAAGPQHWQDLTDEQRDEYSARCRELNQQYSIELEESRKTFDEQQQQILNEIGIRSLKENKAGNSIFFKNQMSLLKEEFPLVTERFAKVNKMWQELSSQKKYLYKAKVQENIKKYSIQLQNWFQTLSAEEQEDYRTCNPKKLQYLKNIQPAVHRTSDSEDEDIEFSSSDEEDNFYEDEEDEEDDDDYDIVFELC